VYSLAVTATRPPTVFAAFEGGGVFKSSDRGATWAPASRGLPDDGWCGLVAAPSHSATLYAACGDGLFKTTTGGALWRQLDLDNAVPPVVAPSDPRVVYEPPEFGVVRSRNGGRRWEQVSTSAPTACASAFAIDPTDPFVLFCGDEQWVKVSRDGGITWRPIAAGARPDAEIETLAIDPSDRDTMLAGTADGRIFKTTTGGASWYYVANGPAAGAVEHLQFVGRSGDVLFARQESSVLRSLDAGDHWQALPPGWTDGGVDAFAVDPSAPSTVFVGTSRGVMVTTDFGGQWTMRNQGVTRAVTSVAFHEGTPPSLYVDTGRETLTSRDGGDTWSAFHPPDGFVLSVDANSRWRSARLPGNLSPVGIAVAAGSPRIIYAATGGPLGGLFGTNGIWRTQDDGRTWQFLDQPDSHTVGQCCQLVADPNDRNTVFATVAGVGIGGGGNIVRRTTDAGLTWSELPLPLSLSLTVLPTVPTTLLAQTFNFEGDGRYVLVSSTDRGDHWVRAGAGLPSNIPITNIAIDPRRPSRLFAGTNGRGVFRSVDAGATWRPTGPVR
jgi:photosystem II stability/assembly factor-like uncharacterized protein